MKRGLIFGNALFVGMRSKMKKHVDEILRYIAVFIFLLALFTLLSGCADLKQYLKEADDLYNKPYYKGTDKQRPEDIAGYYEDNMPDTPENDKAQLLYDRLKKDGWNVNITEQRVKVTRKVVSIDGRRLWPTASGASYDWNDWQSNIKHTEKTIKELGDKFEEND